MVVEGAVERPAHLVVERSIVRAGRDDDHAGIGLEARGKPIYKAVGAVEDAGQRDAVGNVVVAGAAGQEQVHRGNLLHRVNHSENMLTKKAVKPEPNILRSKLIKNLRLSERGALPRRPTKGLSGRPLETFGRKAHVFLEY